MIDFTKIVFDNLFRAQDGEDTAFSLAGLTLGRPGDSLAPDVPQIAIAALRPFGDARLLDIEAAIEGHAVRRGVGTVDRGLPLLTNRRAMTLAGQEHGMNLGFHAARDGIGDQDDQTGDDAGGIDIPLAHERAQAVVESRE